MRKQNTSPTTIQRAVSSRNYEYNDANRFRTFLPFQSKAQNCILTLEKRFYYVR